MPRAAEDLQSDPDINAVLDTLPPGMATGDLVGDILSEHGYFVSSDNYRTHLRDGSIIAAKHRIMEDKSHQSFDLEPVEIYTLRGRAIGLKNELVTRINAARGIDPFAFDRAARTFATDKVNGSKVVKALSSEEYIKSIVRGAAVTETRFVFLREFTIEHVSEAHYRVVPDANAPPWVGIAYDKQSVLNDLKKLLRKSGEVDDFGKKKAEAPNLNADQLFLLRLLETSGRESIPSAELRKLDQARAPVIKDLLDRNQNITREVILKTPAPAGTPTLAKVAQVCLTRYKVWEGAQRIWKGKTNHVFLVSLPGDKVQETLGEFPEIARKYMAKDAGGHPSVSNNELTFGWVRCTEFSNDLWIDEVQTDLNDLFSPETFKALGGMNGVAKFLMERFLSQMRGRGYQKFFMPSYGYRAEHYNSDPPVSLYEDLPAKLRFKRADLMVVLDAGENSIVEDPTQPVMSRLGNLWQNSKIYLEFGYDYAYKVVLESPNNAASSDDAYMVDDQLYVFKPSGWAIENSLPIVENSYETVPLGAIPDDIKQMVVLRDKNVGGMLILDLTTVDEISQHGDTLAIFWADEDTRYAYYDSKDVPSKVANMIKGSKKNLSARVVADIEQAYSNHILKTQKMVQRDHRQPRIPHAWVLASAKPSPVLAAVQHAANVLAGHTDVLQHPYAYHGSGESGLEELDGNWPPYAGGLGYGVYVDYNLDTAQFYGDHVYRVRLNFDEDKIFDLSAESDNRWYIVGLEGRSILIGEQVEPFMFKLHDTTYAVVDGEGDNDECEALINRGLLRETLQRFKTATDKTSKLARALVEDALRTNKPLDSYDLADAYVDEWFAHQEAAGNAPTDQAARELHATLKTAIGEMLNELEALADLPTFISLDEIGRTVQEAGYKAVYFERGGNPGTELLVFDPNDVKVEEELA